MKKLLLSSALIIVFLLTACGNKKPANISQEIYDIGLKAVETIEMYQDGKMNAEEAVNRLDEFENDVNAAKTDSNVYEDNIETYINLAKFDIDLGDSGIDRLNALKKELGVE